MKTLIHLYITSLVLCSSTLLAAPDFWKDSAYAVECHETPIEDVLADFSGNFGVNLVSSDDLSGTCSNWRRADNAIKFLDQLANEFRLQWFVYKGNLYVSPKSDNHTRRFDAGSDFKGAVVGLGLYQEKFGWGELVDSETVIVSGPRRYVDLVGRLANTQKEVEKREKSGNIHIFKLKYAPVEDRNISIRDEVVTIPGVATILKNLLGEDDGTRSPRSAALGSNENSSVSNASLVPRGSPAVSVESDVRTNSIFIRAPEQNYDFYRSIVESLDVSSSLVEIDAIIVDVSREKLKEIGVNFSFVDKNNRGSIETNTTGSGDTDFNLNANATILIKDIGLFYTSLRALEGSGDASIIANTSILTMDNQPAVIDLSETVFIQTVGERVAEVRPVTAGTLLNVTPMTIETDEGNKIKLIVDIEDGKLSSVNVENPIPRIQKTTISTKAVINQNRSLVIGGYHLQKSVFEDKGIPYLKSVPGLGNLFKTKLSRDSHQERLFILTPRVSPTYHNPEDYSSTGSADLVAGAVSRIKRRWSMATKSYVEKTQSLLAELASSKVPSGYEFDVNKDDALGFECYQDDAQFFFKGGQKVTGHGLTAFIGVVTNISDKRITVDESACRGQGLIGVAVYPAVGLDPGKSSEIFVSMESARINTSHRENLALSKN